MVGNGKGLRKRGTRRGGGIVGPAGAGVVGKCAQRLGKASVQFLKDRIRRDCVSFLTNVSRYHARAGSRAHRRTGIWPSGPCSRDRAGSRATQTEAMDTSDKTVMTWSCSRTARRNWVSRSMLGTRLFSSRKVLIPEAANP